MSSAISGWHLKGTWYIRKIFCHFYKVDIFFCAHQAPYSKERFCSLAEHYFFFKSSEKQHQIKYKHFFTGFNNHFTIFALSIWTPQLLTILALKFYVVSENWWMNGKQCRPWWDAAFCGVYAASHLCLQCLLRPLCQNTYSDSGKRHIQINIFLSHDEGASKEYPNIFLLRNKKNIILVENKHTHTLSGAMRRPLFHCGKKIWNLRNHNKTL